MDTGAEHIQQRQVVLGGRNGEQSILAESGVVDQRRMIARLDRALTLVASWLEVLGQQSIHRGMADRHRDCSDALERIAIIFFWSFDRVLPLCSGVPR